MKPVPDGDASAARAPWPRRGAMAAAVTATWRRLGMIDARSPRPIALGGVRPPRASGDPDVAVEGGRVREPDRARSRVRSARASRGARRRGPGIRAQENRIVVTSVGPGGAGYRSRGCARRGGRLPRGLRARRRLRGAAKLAGHIRRRTAPGETGRPVPRRAPRRGPPGPAAPPRGQGAGASWHGSQGVRRSASA